MKKFNPNCILFGFAIVFVIIGIWGQCFERIKAGTSNLFDSIKTFDFTGVINAKNMIEKATYEQLSYHDLMMDIDSVRNNFLGTRVVIKEDTTVVKSDLGSLCNPVARLKDEEIMQVITSLRTLQEVTEEVGANFLYCAAPRKEMYERLPGNVDNYFEDNYSRFLIKLKAEEIPFIDFSETLKENQVDITDIFYYTDHHWKAYSGFLAASAICRKLAALYGFLYNEQYTDIHNYNRTLYSDWFLGSKGKKVGTYFTCHGADDFELITPAFITNLKEEQPIKGEIREGTFEDTVLYLENMRKDYYHITTYSTYCGGDYRLQIVKNILQKEGKKILLVRDSFACVVSPFLALQTNELHICDMRDYAYYVGDKLNLKEYIQEIKPDYVIVLYSGIGSIEESHGKYNFF